MAAIDGLLDRDTELEAIRAALDATASGTGGALAIEGEAGIGKTSLLEAMAVLAAERGMTVLRARATERERDLPYGVMRQLLEPVVTALGEGALAGAATLAAPVFAPVSTDGDDQPADAFGIAHGLYWLVADLADRYRLAVLVDDVQWADSASQRALAYLAQRVDDLAVALAIGIRVGEPDTDEATIDELRRESRRGWLRPRPLAVDAVAEIVSRELGEGSLPSLATACQAATAGNPFLIVETLRAIAGEPDSGDRPADLVERVAVSGAGPSILLRLVRLGEDAATTAAAVSVLEPHATQPAVSALTGLAPEVVTAASERLVASRLLADQMPLTFTHPLVKAAVYNDIPAPRRAGLHARAARLLANQGFAADATAAHLLAAEPAGQAWAVQALEEAATAAMGRGAPESAARYLARALAEPPPPADGDRITAALARAQLRGGDPGGIETLTRLRARSEVSAADVELTVELANAMAVRGGVEEASRIVAEALAVSDGHDEAADQLLRGTMLLMPLAGLEQIPSVALPRPGEHLDITTLHARALLQTAVMLEAGGHGSIPDAAATARRLIADRDAAIATAAGGYPPQLLCVVLTLADQGADGLSLFDPVIEVTRSRGALYGVASGIGARGLCHLLDGDLYAAEVDARTAIAVGDGHRFVNEAYWLAVLVRVLVARGELDAADDALAGAWPSTDPPSGIPGAMLLSARGELHLARARHGAAQDDFRTAAERVAWLPRINQELAATRVGLASAQAALGDLDEAQRTAATAVERARAAQGARGIGLALGVQGRLAGEEGIPLLVEAVEILSATNARLLRAHALVDLGAALRRANRRRDAREPLREGLDLAHRCAATAISERAHTELAAAGARPRSVVLAGVESLTPSELRVARLATGGLTNREIAQQLFVTTKTVETHLRHVYRKLDISRRTELEGALAVPPA